MPRVLQNILIAIVATFVALLTAELLARAVGVPEFGRFMEIHDVPTRTVDGVVLWGTKDPRVDPNEILRAAADADAFKIVGVGDSIMYGVSVSKEATYLERARREAESRSQRKIDILNLAVPGYNSMQEAAVLEELRGRLKPDLVLVSYWGDDAHQYRVVGGYAVDVGDISEDGRFVVRALPLAEHLSDFLFIHSRVYGLLTQWTVARQTRSRGRDWENVTAPLAKIQEQVQSDGGRVVILAAADLREAKAKPVGELGLLKEFAAPRGIEVIDLSDWLQDVPAKNVALDGCHLNAAGHRIIGHRLADYLLERHLAGGRDVASTP